MKPTTSSHSRAAPNGVFPTTRTAPLWSALWPPFPNATSMARMPMMTYMTPRATNPARASQSRYRLWPALRAAYLASRVPRRAVRVTTVASLKTHPHCPGRIELNGTALGHRGSGAAPGTAGLPHGTWVATRPTCERRRRIPMESQTVVVTGGSAGIGRATARLFGARGARVGLIARGQAGLESAAREVREAGGKALAVSADVADYEQVTAAARQIEQRLGPIGVWVNVAFTSVFAPFAEITAEEFRRVTEVSYLGVVYGTMAALSRMRPRDQGTIVQVGSALGDRSIPLQSAYCGAKHAINGFTSSLRCELLHEGSGVHVTVVQMPAVNTPQFSCVRSRLPRQPQPVPPIYQPELAARAIVYAAAHPRRRMYWVGGTTAATLIANRIAPALLDRYLARTGFDSQQTDEPARASRPDNLCEPADGPAGPDFGARGEFSGRSHDRSPQMWLSQHAGQVTAGVTGAAVLGGLVGIARRGQQPA